MKNSKKNLWLLLSFSFMAIGLMMVKTYAKEPWTANQLLEPSALNKILSDPKAPKTYIYSVGYQAIIKNSIDIGPGRDIENQKKLKQQLTKLPKNANIVVYCGCCPFDRCPNVLPVFNLLNEMGFKNYKILNLTHNIKVDWIDKGYAVKK